MSRPRYRAWVEGQMRQVQQIEFNTDGPKYIYIFPGIRRYYKTRERRIIHRIPANEVELMQYTGLNDKNGTEICEGDIIRMRFHEAPDGESFENGVIQWHKESAAYKWYSGDESDLNNYWLTHTDNEYREIIGTTYDNPDLLK